jgi:hypothetical protein
MRLDLLNLASLISQKEINEQIFLLNNKYGLNINLSQWDNFINEMVPKTEKQATIF